MSVSLFPKFIIFLNFSKTCQKSNLNPNIKNRNEYFYWDFFLWKLNVFDLPGLAGTLPQKDEVLLPYLLSRLKNR